MSFKISDAIKKVDVASIGVSTGILIVGHGSRDKNANKEFEEFVSGFRIVRPDLEIRSAYIELEMPDLKTALRQFVISKNNIIIIPLFLFAAGHVKNDIPLAIAEIKREFPDANIVATRNIGIQPELIQLLRERAAKSLQKASAHGSVKQLGRSPTFLSPALSSEAGCRQTTGAHGSVGSSEAGCRQTTDQKKTGVVVVSRGSSDADANSDFFKAVRIFEEGNSYSFAKACFIGIARPSLSESLEMAARMRPEKLLILPYFLFGGKLITKIEEITREFSLKYPWIKLELASYFGPDPLLYSILNHLIENAFTGETALACGTCEYRKQLPGLSNKVGGMQALLWSIRHMETHTQAMPHEFPHKNLKKHVLVCGNVDCAGRGSLPLLNRLRVIIKKEGRQDDIKISKTSCLGRCGEGAVVVVYPDGIWYQKVTENDAKDLVSEHLLNDRIVSRLVDNIMQ